ncbi:Hsp70 protein that interacts with Zuo1p [Stygiomarasmius scandens]|uniref:Hsp70 protein that interacts with Zuo1p n=1 Tax=Marasmiellus scandens TaxID=2682957 RepID=A0ABR1JBZ2_9AGAR
MRVTGCPVFQACEELLGAFERLTGLTEAKVTSRTTSLPFPDDSSSELEGTFIPVILQTPLVTHRRITFNVPLYDEFKCFAFELWQVDEGIRIENAKLEPTSADERGGRNRS